jgi:dimeric dUTPase (all-alpha-NTP-PPase superfamily)
MGALQEMLDDQLELQKVMPPFPSRATSDDPQTTCEFIKDNVLAAVAELIELMEETGWKFWSSSWHVNVDQARAEWIDAWHFMMNIGNKLGMDEELIQAMYNAKRDINRQRQLVGYDGVSTKCPKCKRALDDPATKCTLFEGKRGVCQEYGVWVDIGS